MSRGANLQGGKDGALDGGEVIKPQTGGNVPPVQENSVQPAERYTGEHVTLGPYVSLRVKERIGAHGDQVMERINRIGGDGAEWNHQTQA